jgi:hypothetical protein
MMKLVLGKVVSQIPEVAELAYAEDSKSSPERGKGSTPFFRNTMVTVP